MWQHLARLIDLMRATEEPSTLPNLTYGELAALLGVQAGADGNIETHALINACIGVQTNPNVTRLPEAERLRAIRSASAALDQLMYGGGR